MRVLVACEFSGIVRDAFIAKGHDAISCDLLDTERPGPHYKGSVLDIINNGFDLMIAHPPCTYFAAPGMHYLKTKSDRIQKLNESFEFIKLLWNVNIEKICIENPVGWLNTNWRRPSQIIHPWFFGDKEMKKTCLWLKNLSRLNGLIHIATYPASYFPKPDKMTKVGKDGYARGVYYCGRINSTIGRRDQKLAAHLKAKTFPGIAQAMADQWG